MALGLLSPSGFQLLHHDREGVGPVHERLGRPQRAVVRTGLRVRTCDGDAEEIATVLHKLEGHALYAIAAVDLGTGLRRGELLALPWSNLDLDGACLRVERSLEETKAGLRFKGPKTVHGKRMLALPPNAVAERASAPAAGNATSARRRPAGTRCPRVLRRRVDPAQQAELHVAQYLHLAGPAQGDVSRAPAHPRERLDRRRCRCGDNQQAAWA